MPAVSRPGGRRDKRQDDGETKLYRENIRPVTIIGPVQPPARGLAAFSCATPGVESL